MYCRLGFPTFKYIIETQLKASALLEGRGGRGAFLVASPEKALVDCLYIASRRGKNYGTFPELEFPRGFRRRRARGWVARIRDARLRAAVAQKLEALLAEEGQRAGRR